MKYTDRELVDALMNVILASSRFIDRLLEEEIDIIISTGNVNVVQLSALSRARQRFEATAYAMQFALLL